MQMVYDGILRIKASFFNKKNPENIWHLIKKNTSILTKTSTSTENSPVPLLLPPRWAASDKEGRRMFGETWPGWE